MEGVRGETDPLKRDPRDFTLWMAAEPGREVKWDSPWGEGFPGWHIECSAMASKYLGEKFDIHTGGVDNIFPHHEDEIAQSEGAFGHQHVNYWIHGQHLLADGAKMAKSSGNVFLIDDLVTRGFAPLSFRYLCSTVRYRVSSTLIRNIRSQASWPAPTVRRAGARCSLSPTPAPTWLTPACGPNATATSGC